jgi:tripartite-type tricarboxylate transporter receptor subunit TctC
VAEPAVRFVVPFAPGGSSEIVARSTAVELTKLLGQSVYVENKPGGAGNVAWPTSPRRPISTRWCSVTSARSRSTRSSSTSCPTTRVKDFKPVSLLAKVPSLYVVHPDVPAKNLKEFVALGQGEAGQLNYGSAGNGSAGHLAFEYLKMVTGIFVLHVPYRGTGPQLTDLLAGRLQAASVGAPAILQFIKTGKLRCIATGTTQRIAQLPDVPTVAEQGWPGFEMTQWYGLMAPANLAQPALDKLAAAAAKAMREPTALERLNNDAAIAVGGTPAEFAAFIAQEREALEAGDRAREGQARLSSGRPVPRFVAQRPRAHVAVEPAEPLLGAAGAEVRAWRRWRSPAGCRWRRRCLPSGTRLPRSGGRSSPSAASSRAWRGRPESASGASSAACPRPPDRA